MALFPEQDARGEFLRALRRNNAAQAYSLREEAGVDPAGIAGAFVVQGDNAAAESLCESLETAGLTVLRIREEELFGILLTRDDGQEAAQDAVEVFRTFAPADGAAVFHVTGIRGPEEAGSAFAFIQEAREAARIIFPAKAVYDRYDLALARSAAVIYEKDPLQRQEYASWFDPFRTLSVVKRRQFLETLEIFVLDAAQNTQQTGRLMGVHTNTVQYRLHRVEERLGTAVMQEPCPAGLALALALRRLAKTGQSRRRGK